MRTTGVKLRLNLILFVFLLVLIRSESLTSQYQSNSNEIGLCYGNYSISGDVEHAVFPGWGLGIHYRTALNHAFSIRPQLFYGITHGLDAKPTSDGIYQEPDVFEGYSTDQPWFYAFQSKIIRLQIQGILELTNLGYQRKFKNFNLYLLGGIGVNSYGTWLNLHDENGLIYTNLLNSTSFQVNNDYNTIAGREAIREALKSIYDDTYETPAFKKEGAFRLGDETNIAFEASFGIGFSYRLSPKLNISLEHELFLSNNDYLDGLRWRTQYDVTNNFDIGHFTNIRVSYNLSLPEKQEPLYWVNPWEENQYLLDSLANRIVLLENGILDLDKDGIINVVDQEPNSVSNCPVDSKGITLDSDRDGVADCYDKFPFGDKSDIEGVITEYLKTHNIESKSNSKEIAVTTNDLNSKFNQLNNKRLSLIFLYFDTDSYQVDEDQYPALASIASFIKENNTKCINIIGHADHQSEEMYNDSLGMNRAQAVINILSEEFGITNVNFIPGSKGEYEPLLLNPRLPSHNRVNRRVEFKVCE